MIIFSYLNREVLKSTSAVLSVLLVIFVSQKFVSILADATEGKIPADLVIKLLGFNMPTLLALMLPLSVFLGILLGVSRLYAESEMTVLKACGISEWYATRVILFQSIILGIIAGMMSLWWGPLLLEQEYQVREEAEKSAKTVLLAPGKFQQGPGGTVLMVEALEDKGNRMERIFLAQNPRQSNKPGSVLVAQVGEFEDRDDGALLLHLTEGARYVGEPGLADFEKQQFGKYSMLLRDRTVKPKRRKEKARSIPDLLKDGSNDAMAEVHWRLAVPLSIPLMTLIAVPMAAVNPRQGKFAKLGPAFMLYLGYYLLLMTGRSALEDGKIPQELGLWWVHILTLLVGSLLILKGRTYGNRFRLWWQKTVRRS